MGLIACLYVFSLSFFLYKAKAATFSVHNQWRVYKRNIVPLTSTHHPSLLFLFSSSSSTFELFHQHRTKLFSYTILEKAKQLLTLYHPPISLQYCEPLKRHCCFMYTNIYVRSRQQRCFIMMPTLVLPAQLLYLERRGKTILPFPFFFNPISLSLFPS